MLQHMKILVSPCPHQQLLIIAFLVAMLWNLIVVLICIFQMTNDTEHLRLISQFVYVFWSNSDILLTWVVSLSGVGKSFTSWIYYVL